MKVNDIPSLARFLLSPDCRSVCILSGAGISVASGIPDFRSPGGMYETLRPELLTATDRERQLMAMEPTYVVSWDIFQHNQFPYMEVRRPFILGSEVKKWRPTIAHRFVEMVHTKLNKLTRVYTQNIDGLDRQCEDIPSDKIINVHGSISQVSCEGCEATMPFSDFCDSVRSNIKDIYGIDSSAPKSSTPILCRECEKPLVKPSTVLFGGAMPMEFFERCEEDLPKCDLLFVVGTSLVVGPANSVVWNVPDECIRVIVNNEQVGKEIGIKYGDAAERDLFLQGYSDDVFLNLIKELDWLDDLRADLLPEKSAKLLEDRTSQGKGQSS